MYKATLERDGQELTVTEIDHPWYGMTTYVTATGDDGEVASYPTSTDPQTVVADAVADGYMLISEEGN